MRVSRSLVLLLAASLFAGATLRAQSLEASPTTLHRAVAERARPGQVFLRIAASEARRPRRWPYVIGGAVLGAAGAGIWLGHAVNQSNDQMVFPQFVIGIVGIGAGVGALGGLIVSLVAVPPRH